ncbi:hypothetical protein [Streptomyces sp. NEAU-H3]|uniref:hypothetical protein n=1 Tax=Streptomyces sp. NEAU-H3 TaxID=2720636 RepID=UPI00143BC559|nr:hypothetical protein [Streptomyces sp. NEAU-H3]NJA56688.1 hypothetical protein [Streptomyces sp. NEAU-H3]
MTGRGPRYQDQAGNLLDALAQQRASELVRLGRAEAEATVAEKDKEISRLFDQCDEYEEQLAEAGAEREALVSLAAGAERGRLAVEDERDRARRWAVHLEGENRRLTAQVEEAREQARVATVAALNLQRQTPDLAQATLARVRKARTWGQVWIELGQYFGLTAEEAGLEARARRVGEGDR